MTGLGHWIHPTGAGPWPVVLFSPGSDGDETEQLADAAGLARRGIASLTLAPPRPVYTCNARTAVRAFSRYVIGRRRALDALPSLPGADPSRVAAVGFSFGGAVTTALAGVEGRLRGAVIQSAPPRLSVPIADFCGTVLGRKQLAAFRRDYSVIDARHYVARARTAPLLFQHGRRDGLAPAGPVNALFRVVREPKELRWYDAPHELNERAHEERDAWLADV